MIQNITGKDILNAQPIFLDLDGTIARSGEGCKNSIRFMCGKIGMELTEEEINHFVGPAIIIHLQQAHGFSEGDATRAYKFYREYYDSKGIYENWPYSGIEALLQRLCEMGRTLYVATLKPQEQAEQILARFGFTEYFTAIFGASYEKGRTNKERVMEYADRTIGGIPQSAAIVGDRYHDVLAGKHMGIGTVGVTYGYGSPGELTEAGCDVLVDTVEEIAEVFGGKAV